MVGALVTLAARILTRYKRLTNIPMAVRYSQKEKDKVIAFVSNYNKKNKRGGQTAAAKEFGISPITIANWLKKSGAKKSSGARRGRKAAAKPKASVGNLSSVLARMQEIQTEIEALQGEYEALKAKL